MGLRGSQHTAAASRPVPRLSAPSAPDCASNPSFTLQDANKPFLGARNLNQQVSGTPVRDCWDSSSVSPGPSQWGGGAWGAQHGNRASSHCPRAACSHVSTCSACATGNPRHTAGNRKHSEQPGCHMLVYSGSVFPGRLGGVRAIHSLAHAEGLGVGVCLCPWSTAVGGGGGRDLSQSGSNSAGPLSWRCCPRGGSSGAVGAAMAVGWNGPELAAPSATPPARARLCLEEMDAVVRAGWVPHPVLSLAGRVWGWSYPAVGEHTHGRSPAGSTSGWVDSPCPPGIGQGTHQPW